MSRVTVVPSDKLVLVDGQPLGLAESVFKDANFHALQWSGEAGEIEYGNRNEAITDYDTYVKPFVDAWTVEKERLDAQKQAEEEFYNSPEQVAYREQGEAKQQAQNVLMMRSFAPMLQTASFEPAEFALFAKAQLFPLWQADTDYIADQRIQHNGIVYRVVQAVHSLEHQAPDAEARLAIYEPLHSEEGDHTGTVEDPIPFIYGMTTNADKFYSYKGNVYLCMAEMSPCIWYPDTPGLWQWELLSNS